MIYRYQGKRITGLLSKGHWLGVEIFILGHRVNIRTTWLSNIRWRWKCYRRGWNSEGHKA